MSMILDLVTVAVILFLIGLAARKGFLRSLIELVGFGVSIAVAWMLSTSVGNWIYSNLLETPIKSAVSSWSQNASESAREAFAQMLGQYVSGGAGSSSFSSGAMQTLSNAVSAGGSIFQSALEQPVDLLGAAIGRGIAFILIMIICLAAVRLIARISDLLKRVPIIGGINRLGGAVIGIAEAAIVIFVFCTLAAVLIPIFAVQQNPPITAEVIDKSYLFKFFYHANPFLDIL